MASRVLGKVKARTAAFRYRNPARSVRVIAIAGEYGKTTTALLLSEVLQEAGLSVLVLTNQGNFFNGEPKDYSYDTNAHSLQRCLAFARRKNADIVIVELTDELIESHVLTTIDLEMSIITAESATAQALLSQPVNYAVIPSGFSIDNVSVAPHQAISFGEDQTAEAQIKDVKLYRKGTEVDLVIDHQTNLKLATHLAGKANAFNIAAAAAAAYILPVETSVFEEGIARLEGVAGNYNYFTYNENFSVVFDIATSQKSVELLLDSASELKKRRLIVVLDTTVSDAAIEHAKKASDRLIVVGKAGDGMAGVEFEPTPKEAAEVALRGAKKDDTVLFVGKEYATVGDKGVSELQRMVEDSGEQQ